MDPSISKSCLYLAVKSFWLTPSLHELADVVEIRFIEGSSAAELNTISAVFNTLELISVSVDRLLLSFSYGSYTVNISSVYLLFRQK